MLRLFRVAAGVARRQAPRRRLYPAAIEADDLQTVIGEVVLHTGPLAQVGFHLARGRRRGGRGLGLVACAAELADQVEKSSPSCPGGWWTVALF